MKKLALLSVVVAACGPAIRESAQRTLTPAEEAKFSELVAAGDAAFAERGQRAKLEEAIRAWEQAAALKDDSRAWSNVARGTYLLADGYVLFDENSDEAYLATMAKGMDAGTKAIRAYSGKVARKLDLGAKLEDVAGDVEKDGVPALYWYATCLGKWAKKQGTAKAVLYKDTILKIMGRCKALDEDFFYGAPYRYFGAFYSFAPPFAGGDVEKGKANFEEAIKRFPDYLATRVLYAEIYATKMQDEDLFKSQLQIVLESKEDAIPEVTFENQVAKKQAQLLLSRLNEYF
ncbi:MAG: TRAP transporter TatT component family protein [Myxococcota bacterium]